MVKKDDKIISSGEPMTELNGERLSTFKRDVGIPAKPEDVKWLYFVWLCSQVGLNGPDKTQQHRTKETDSKTYFTLALKLFNKEFKAFVPRDTNRVADARALRDRFALSESSFQDYSVLDTPGASILEVMVALVQRFDNDVMMTSDEIDRSKDWFWEMLRNCDLDIYVDEGFNEIDNKANETCNAIIETINSRCYASDGKGGFFPLKHPKSDQTKVELWIQMHAYFLENHIE